MVAVCWQRFHLLIRFGGVVQIIIYFALIRICLHPYLVKKIVYQCWGLNNLNYMVTLANGVDRGPKRPHTSFIDLIFKNQVPIMKTTSVISVNRSK